MIQFIGSGTPESGPPRPQALALGGSRADGNRRLRDPGISLALRGPELTGRGQSRAGLGGAAGGVEPGPTYEL